jgi:excisionase family DNA binding protein
MKNGATSDPIERLREELTEQIRSLRRELALRDRRLLSIPEAAAYLGLKPQTIRNALTRRAKKPFPVKPCRLGGRTLFKRADLDEFIDRLGGSNAD